MTDKELKKIEQTIKKVIKEILDIDYIESDEPTIPISLIDEMEDYMGETILFMGIS